MRSCCLCFITTIVIIVVAMTTAFAVRFILTNIAQQCTNEEEKPKFIALLSILGVIGKRLTEYPDSVVDQSRTRCTCRTTNPNVIIDKDNVEKYCQPDDPCNPITRR